MDRGNTLVMGEDAFRTCRFCGDTKPLVAGFYTHPFSAGGYSTKCKECTKKYEKARRISAPEAIRSYEAVRSTDPKRRALSRRISREWRLNNPEKRRAHHLVATAIDNGTIVRKPCEKCGEARAEAHHEDYSKPLMVVFLCSRCHKRRHQEISAEYKLRAAA